MQKTLSPAERLIIEADFTPESVYPFSPGEFNCRENIKKKVLELADSLQGTGIYLKVNSVLRACGYDLIKHIKMRGLKVFADLKLIDIPITLSTDGKYLLEENPEIVTVMCVSGMDSMEALKVQLPHTEVLGVTVLTNFTDGNTFQIFGANISSSIKNLALLAEEAGIDGLICAPRDLATLKRILKKHMTLNTPNVRPEGVSVENDDQNSERTMTISEAIRAGATRIIMGRPIIYPPNGRTRRDVVMETIQTIANTAKSVA